MYTAIFVKYSKNYMYKCLRCKRRGMNIHAVISELFGLQNKTKRKKN